MSKISRVLVANRGEIAVRIIKACKLMGIQSVLTVSEADRDSLPAKMADRVICIGAPLPKDSYLKYETIITAALGTGADAIHPGYGFLAEKTELVETCDKYGLIFIGPRAEHINKLGNKIIAREIVRELGIPVTPGSEKIKNFKEAMEVGEKVKYPLLLKASAGGGGKGMRIVMRPEELQTAFESAAAEAQGAFGDNSIYIEHYFANARHIEVQIIGDHFGNVIHLGERDCSLQRRYQKIIEESPASTLTPELKERILTAGKAIASKIGYISAGTVEFILDQDSEQFYFLEMNTRIQVEHPVTEMISGVDIVKEQINVAANNPLTLTQSDVKLEGHSIECRINAESPEAGFKPSPGRITRWNPAEGLDIRVDSHCYSGYFVPPYYDSLLAKVIVKGKTRSEAIGSMETVLGSFEVDGVHTTIPILRQLISHPAYKEGKINVRWVEDFLKNG